MAWETVFFDGLEEPFQTQDDIPKVVPRDHAVQYDHTRRRPEMDAKIHPQREVFEGRQSAVGFLPFSTFRWWCHTSTPIALTPGLRTRGRATLMIVSHGIDGDDSRPGACGMRVGVSSADEFDPFSDGIVWSDWWVVRDNLDNERVWHDAETRVYTPQSDEGRLWIQCNSDEAVAISAGHWDNERVEQFVGGGNGDPVSDEHIIELAKQVMASEWGERERGLRQRLAEAIAGK